MKIKSLLLSLLITAGAHAQTPQNYTPTIVAYEFANLIDIAAGQSVTFVYGCNSTWSKPLTITGPKTSASFGPAMFGLSGDPAGCPGGAGAPGQPGVAILEKSTTQTVGLHTYINGAYSAAVTTTIPALTTAVTTPPVTTPPIATQPVCAPSASTITYNSDGSVDIHEAPNCMLIQVKGAWGQITDIPGYNIWITGDTTQTLFAPGNGTNVSH